MKTFTEWVSNTQVNFVLKNYRSQDPEVKTRVKFALDTFGQQAQNTTGPRSGINDPHYLEAILSLEDILPALLQDPIYRKSAEAIQMVLQADKAEMGI